MKIERHEPDFYEGRMKYSDIGGYVRYEDYEKVYNFLEELVELHKIDFEHFTREEKSSLFVAQTYAWDKAIEFIDAENNVDNLRNLA